MIVYSDIEILQASNKMDFANEALFCLLNFFMKTSTRSLACKLHKNVWMLIHASLALPLLPNESIIDVDNVLSKQGAMHMLQSCMQARQHLRVVFAVRRFWFA